ncbi:MAG: aminotransferase class V-fold PLP-dependent enzyme [Gemmatimonadales bacterium]|jgi:selenocysteine lyase/cysteine desulfurase
MREPFETALYDVAALRRSEFPWADERGAVYLNSASTGPLPNRTRQAIEEFTAMAVRPDESLYEAHRDVPVQGRRACAELIGARPEEIALGANTTFGLNLASSALALGPGDQVLLMDGEFPANVYPWLNLQSRGVVVEFIPRDARGLPDEAAALERLARGDIRVFSASLVNFCTGYRLDLDAVSAECRRHGTYLVVDAIQALGAVPLDVAATPIDILACGGQKWLLSPQGSGFAYVRRELIDRLDPITVGWLAYQPSQDYGNLLRYALEPMEDARRFELGSLAFCSVDACNHSLALLLELGVPRIERHIRSVQQTLIGWVESRADVEMVSDLDPRRRSGIVAFRVPDAPSLHQAFRAAGITVSVREGAIRVSVHAYNSREEMEHVISVAERELDR